MSMRTQVIDAGETEPRKLPHGWGGWHLQVLAEAIEAEGGQWKEAFAPGWTFTEWHGFVDESDGERFAVSPGDTFLWWWN